MNELKENLQQISGSSGLCIMDIGDVDLVQVLRMYLDFKLQSIPPIREGYVSGNVCTNHTRTKISTTVVDYPLVLVLY